ncbi:hypothetical protein UFOVP833_11 [uncultured Caudovirales phage]|uniref:Uncharacterized protein n=1 Tax=uncultured Caudovirales phage TaxID=2100421 RepID=A0A6J5SU84_9CAUD|nr:hypothetical protein UFOVP833_11 [uncultured Caudovirales phage]CAB4218131.1 hypothetical protein UFOVP1603_14 [uncultured Caudovirales phage]
MPAVISLFSATAGGKPARPLSEKQVAAALAAIARDAASATQKANARHVGTVGERREFDLTIRHVHSYETAYNGCTRTVSISIMEDTAGNVVVYKGSFLADKGETLKMVASVKEHGHRDGVAQTIIQRPKLAA